MPPGPPGSALADIPPSSSVATRSISCTNPPLLDGNKAARFVDDEDEWERRELSPNGRDRFICLKQVHDEPQPRLQVSDFGAN